MFRIISSLMIFAVIVFSDVLPLIETAWNQGCYYNDSCPEISGGQCGKAWTGCFATAAGQIFRYYKYPPSGWGSHSYTPTGFPVQSADFSSAVYKFDSMGYTLSSSNTYVAQLLKHIGIAVDMAYSKTNSTSFFQSTALKQYFKYSPKMYSTSTFLFSTTADWENAVKQEIDSGRPVFVKGGGHFYLIDGYNYSPTIKFHTNFGWGGSYNGYYSISSIVVNGTSYTPVNAIFNIQPMKSSLETNTDSLYFSMFSAIQYFEFSSTMDWTIAVSDTSWMKLDVKNGLPGYFNSSNAGKITVTANSGVQRAGIVVLSNSDKSDTIKIIQAGSSTNSERNDLNLNKMIFTYYLPNKLRVILNESFASNIKSMAAIDMAGRKFNLPYFKNVSSLDVDIAKLRSGVYLLRISANKEERLAKFVVVR